MRQVGKVMIFGIYVTIFPNRCEIELKVAADHWWEVPYIHSVGAKINDLGRSWTAIAHSSVSHTSLWSHHTRTLVSSHPIVHCTALREGRIWTEQIVRTNAATGHCIVFQGCRYGGVCENKTERSLMTQYSVQFSSVQYEYLYSTIKQDVTMHPNATNMF